jgi:membrane-associated protein
VFDLIQDFFRFVYNVPKLIEVGGLIGLTIVIFSETGLMVGFFLPGDSLLVTAGVVAAGGLLNIYTLIPTLILAAICGNATGYFIGKRAGKALYSRKDSFFFRRQHLISTHEFYEKHGGATIIMAQFMPIVRTFAPVVAGAADMTYRRFASFNVIGAITWITSMTLTGFLLGRSIPNIDKNIHFVVAIVIGLSLLPAVYAAVKSRTSKSKPEPQANREQGAEHESIVAGRTDVSLDQPPVVNNAHDGGPVSEPVQPPPVGAAEPPDHPRS